MAALATGPEGGAKKGAANAGCNATLHVSGECPWA